MPSNYRAFWPGNTNANEAVERVAKAMHSYRQRIDPECYADWAEEVDRSDRFPELGYIVTTMDEASAAIQAHTAYLWERAMQPDVVEAAALAIGRDEQCEILPTGEEKCPSDEWLIDEYRDTAIAGLTATLTALLGPRPEEGDE